MKAFVTGIAGFIGSTLAERLARDGADVVGAEWQNRRHVDPNWYVGKGKAEELLHAKSETGFTLLVADDEPSVRRVARRVLERFE